MKEYEEKMRQETTARWEIGSWRNYEGWQVNETLMSCLLVISEFGLKASIQLAGEPKPLATGNRLFEILMDYEEAYGVGDLLEALVEGIRIDCSKADGTRIIIEISTRVPSETEERERMFKDMVIDWLRGNPMTFVEWFLHTPSRTKHMDVLIVNHPLLQALKKKFGFSLVYKIVIVGEGLSPETPELRKKLYRILG